MKNLLDLFVQPTVSISAFSEKTFVTFISTIVITMIRLIIYSHGMAVFLEYKLYLKNHIAHYNTSYKISFHRNFLHIFTFA